MFGWLGRQRRKIGDIGEALAAKYLKDAGYRLVESNFTCRSGEIDLIARKDDTLVFVEVKLRTCGQFGTPEESVDARKLTRLRKAVCYYISTHNIDNLNMRLDVICVEDDGSGHLHTRHLEDAAPLEE